MKNRVGETLVLLALILAGVICRVYFRGIPNFMPVAGMALFAGYFFRSRWQGLIVPLAIMLMSDYFLTGYQWQMRLVVYGAMLLPVGLGALLRVWIPLANLQGTQLWGASLGLVGCSLASSVTFFLVTNFAWWPWSSMYEHNLAGLLHCYAAGLPFFRYTLAGDLFFSASLFGAYALALQGAHVEGTNLTAAKGISK